MNWAQALAGAGFPSGARARPAASTAARHVERPTGPHQRPTRGPADVVRAFRHRPPRGGTRRTPLGPAAFGQPASRKNPPPRPGSGRSRRESHPPDLLGPRGPLSGGGSPAVNTAWDHKSGVRPPRIHCTSLVGLPGRGGCTGVQNPMRGPRSTSPRLWRAGACPSRKGPARRSSPRRRGRGRFTMVRGGPGSTVHLPFGLGCRENTESERWVPPPSAIARQARRPSIGDAAGSLTKPRGRLPSPSTHRSGRLVVVVVRRACRSEGRPCPRK